MPPRKSKKSKAAAAKIPDVPEPTVAAVVEEEVVVVEPVVAMEVEAVVLEDEDKSGDDKSSDDKSGADEGSASATGSSTSKLTMEERAAKMEALRAKMVRTISTLLTPQRSLKQPQPQRDSTAANRKDLVAEHNRAKFGAKEAARMEKQRRLAETLRETVDAEDRGEDLERRKNWEYSIEENDEWEKRKARKERRADFQFHGAFDSSVGCYHLTNSTWR
jgi:pre-mRNA-splicing factor SYF2